MKLTVTNEFELPQAALAILAATKDSGCNVITFYGEMGAGKTTLIKALCHAMNVNEIVNSPTFSIVNEYITKDDDLIYHFDFYRINKISEALDIGYEDYIDSGKMCLMEWPEKIEEILPEHRVVIQINVKQDLSRIIELEIK